MKSGSFSFVGWPISTTTALKIHVMSSAESYNKISQYDIQSKHTSYSYWYRLSSVTIWVPIYALERIPPQYHTAMLYVHVCT